MTRLYSETEVVARVEGLTVTELRMFVSTECVLPFQREGKPAFTETDLARLHLLRELAADFDLDADAAGLVVGLIDQIHGLRHELRTLGAAVEQEAGDVRARILARLTKPE
jgi:chaperone modulatory protein CbpM